MDGMVAMFPCIFNLRNLLSVVPQAAVANFLISHFFVHNVKGRPKKPEVKHQEITTPEEV